MEAYAITNLTLQEVAALSQVLQAYREGEPGGGIPDEDLDPTEPIPVPVEHDPIPVEVDAIEEAANFIHDKGRKELVALERRLDGSWWGKVASKVGGKMVSVHETGRLKNPVEAWNRGPAAYFEALDPVNSYSVIGSAPGPDGWMSPAPKFGMIEDVADSRLQGLGIRSKQGAKGKYRWQIAWKYESGGAIFETADHDSLNGAIREWEKESR